MLIKATLAAAISAFCSPAICDELRAYTITVMEQIRHEITVFCGRGICSASRCSTGDTSNLRIR